MATNIFHKLSAFLMLSSSIMVVHSNDFYQDFDLTWGGNRAVIIDRGKLLRLSLDSTSGSGFQSKKEYLFGRIDMQLKLVHGNSAGTVTAYYLSSEGPYHDEIDFEFLGNTSGEPYIVHTNIYTQGKGEREQQFYLWFDPTRNFHSYTFLWSPQQIIFLVDNIPIRIFNNEGTIPFPKDQPMKLYSSLWCAEQWATRGGQVKTNWTEAPFRAYYRNFNANACTQGSSSSSSCASETIDVDASTLRKLKWVQKRYMIYNYCTDFDRFPRGLPKECQSSRFT